VVAVWLHAGCSVYDTSLLPNPSQPVAGSAGMADLGGGSGDIGGTSAGQASGGVSGSNTAGKPAGGTSPSGGVSGSGTGPGSGSGGVIEGGASGSAGEAGQAAAAGAGDAGAPMETPPHELALNKSALASTTQTGNEAFKGNDADQVTRWCAANGDFPQWWRVDLGAAHELKSFAIRLEYPERLHSFLIETSQDDVTYTAVPGATFTDVVGDVQASDFPADASARYVRVSITNAAPDPVNQPHFTWASFFELSVLGL
jgi:F5/8 type C domain-containing protein